MKNLNFPLLNLPTRFERNKINIVAAKGGTAKSNFLQNMLIEGQKSQEKLKKDLAVS